MANLHHGENQHSVDDQRCATRLRSMLYYSTRRIGLHYIMDGLVVHGQRTTARMGEVSMARAGQGQG
ncbi:hypothetical protein Cob_v004644 [Colletotrichum orbiculare MAFF 240422]|uniref:Uncharacterized protein n=1 Tax=Colletotrichum orbiculare (strain 104-T / ATCC 96160 / CBS 514.97 / LARS 414 / MAFF 240422) TaxID=1213857 RepID=A0A484FWR1_COLOR|nr:hypothetical protein Cob_v004644 [Colletotrichum orbiculare MAFF 240422]